MFRQNYITRGYSALQSTYSYGIKNDTNILLNNTKIVTKTFNNMALCVFTQNILFLFLELCILANCNDD